MLRRWLLYLAALVGCTVFLIAYQERLAWVVLVGVICLPVLGLAVSLPMMLTTRPRLTLPRHCTAGDAVEVRMEFTGKLGVPALKHACDRLGFGGGYACPPLVPELDEAGKKQVDPLG